MSVLPFSLLVDTELDKDMWVIASGKSMDYYVRYQVGEVLGMGEEMKGEEEEL